MSILSNQVEGVVRNALSRFSKAENTGVDRLALWVEPSPEGLKLFILLDAKKLREIKFRDLINQVENLTFKGLGFDISKDLPEYFTGFMLSVQNGKGIPMDQQRYFIRLIENTPVMFLFVNGQKVVFNDLADSTRDPLARFKISLETILKTS
jgi:hypothetical protein